MSDLVGNDLMAKADGSVSGTFHHVTGYTEFSSEPDEQDGYYFPFHLTKTGSKMTFKKNGSPTKQDTFEVLVDGKSVVIFRFDGASFE